MSEGGPIGSVRPWEMGQGKGTGGLPRFDPARLSPKCRGQWQRTDSARISRGWGRGQGREDIESD